MHTLAPGSGESKRMGAEAGKSEAKRDAVRRCVSLPGSYFFFFPVLLTSGSVNDEAFDVSSLFAKWMSSRERKAMLVCSQMLQHPHGVSRTRIHPSTTTIDAYTTPHNHSHNNNNNNRDPPRPPPPAVVSSEEKRSQRGHQSPLQRHSVQVTTAVLHHRKADDSLSVQTEND